MALASAPGVTPAELRAQDPAPVVVPLGYTLGVILGVIGTLSGLATAWVAGGFPH